MRELNKRLLIACILIAMIGCLSKPAGQFIEQDLILVRPYNKTDTVIFTSKKDQADTIVFFHLENDSGQVKNFELGYFNYRSMEVKYALTNASFHIVNLPKSEKQQYTIPKKFYGVNIASIKEYNSRAISFLGLYFDDSMIRVLPINNDIIEFKSIDSNKLNKTIFSFKFSSNVGIISFVDTAKVEWSRKKNRNIF